MEIKELKFPTIDIQEELRKLSVDWDSLMCGWRNIEMFRYENAKKYMLQYMEREQKILNKKCLNFLFT
jgi:hypothetical protein